MDAILRRLKLRKRDPRDDGARKSLQEHLYKYSSNLYSAGLPSRPSALAHDAYLDLLAIGTRSGALRLYGQPGVCLQGQHKGGHAVLHIIFIAHQEKLITVCSDNSLHLWLISKGENQSSVLEEKSFNTDFSRLKAISSCCPLVQDNLLLLGTEDGSVHFFSISSFSVTDKVISQDLIPDGGLDDVMVEEDDCKTGPGAVESICQHPVERNKVLIGFSHGLICLWNIDENVPVRIYNSMQTLEHLSFIRSGEEFVSSHADGSYILWNTVDASVPKEPATTPYGPFPCNSIRKIIWKASNEEPFLIFSGGMPRASYGDRYTITAMHGESHVVFDFTSKVVDFVALCRADELDTSGPDDGATPYALIVLMEEELLAIDLTSASWPLFRQPYLVSLHCSVVTSISYVSDVPELLWNRIVEVGNIQFAQHSSQQWPIKGGNIVGPKSVARELLLTGHEDGSINFWDISLDGSIRLLHKLNTANLFGIDTSNHLDRSEDLDGYEEWPPFRKVGIYDPFSDDPRLAIRKIHLCVLSETFIVAGTAGQIILFQYEREEREQDVQIATINIVADRENFSWRGHSALEVKNLPSKLATGFHPVCVVQMLPPVPCTALAFQPEWQLLSIGTAYGMGLFDYARCKVVYTKCTLSSSGESGESAIISRRKSLQRIMRQSFRRLRGQTVDMQRPPPAEPVLEKNTDGKLSTQADVTEQGDARKSAFRCSERNDQPESTLASDASGSLPFDTSSRSYSVTSAVCCLHFAQVFLLNTQASSSSLWMGTNHGSVFIFQLTLGSSDRRIHEPVQCTIAKEIRLRHGAPVISIQALDRSGLPLPGPLEVQHERAKAPDMTGSHFVLICSQQQLKVFTLPHLKPYNKFKFSTQRPNLRVARLAFASFRSKTDESYIETDAIGLSSEGEMTVFTLPQLRPQLSQDVISKENSSAINGCVFTPNGMGYFLCSPSEITRFSLSARFPSLVCCNVGFSEIREIRSFPADNSVSEDAATGGRSVPTSRNAKETRRDNTHIAGDGRGEPAAASASNSLSGNNSHESRSPSQAPGLNETSVVSQETERSAGVISLSDAADNAVDLPRETGAVTASILASNMRTFSGSVDPVTCGSVIIPFSTKVIEADIHEPPIGGMYSFDVCKIQDEKEFCKPVASDAGFISEDTTAAKCLSGVR